MKNLACILVLAPVIAGFASAKIIYVDGDAAGANNGESWSDAYIYLQDALTFAASGPWTGTSEFPELIFSLRASARLP